MKGIEGIEELGATLTVRLGDEIDHHIAKGMRAEIDKRIFESKPDILVLDFKRVKFMDSSGIGMIIGRAELCRELNSSLRIVGLSPSLARLVRLSGIEKIRNITII